MDKADAIFMFCTGGNGHYTFKEPERIAVLKRAAARGAGLMFYHYCVEPPAESGHAEMLDWIGGYFEEWWSVNPTWTAEFKELPKHPHRAPNEKTFALSTECWCCRRALTWQAS